MVQWNPELYLKFAGPRLRPGLDLLARIQKDDVQTVYDLGCGTGNLTGYLAARWREADIVGVDTSTEMLQKARADYPDTAWVEADLADWLPETPADVLYSNACFHWLEDHESLFPHLAQGLKSGGVFAIQMPRNFSSPAHTLMKQAAAESSCSGKLLPAILHDPVSPPEVYYDLFAPLSRSIDIWETVYFHVLEGDNPVAEWNRGTALRPALEALENNEDREAFYTEYSRRVRAAYPPRADGKTLFPFQRLFIVAEIV